MLLSSRSLARIRLWKLAPMRHLGRLTAPAHTSCFVSLPSSQPRAGVCGLDKDVFQLFGPGFSFKADTLLMAKLNRALKLAQPLELLLINSSLHPAHRVHVSPKSNTLDLVSKSQPWGSSQGEELKLLCPMPSVFCSS